MCLLFVMAQAAAAAMGGDTADAAQPRQAAGRNPAPLSLEMRLEHKLDAARKCRNVIHFFSSRRRLFSSEDDRVAARTALQRATRRLARLTENIAGIRRALRGREARRLASAPPKVAICNVFGGRYCGQALAVAWCESRHRTTARNGEYLGLFQMGWNERQLFGHGRTAHAQALAARRYFVLSGRDWSPWSCKPWFGY
ncbi:MAG: hypothetical protein ACRDNY_04530 [Gaiellaceae bacterium]